MVWINGDLGESWEYVDIILNDVIVGECQGGGNFDRDYYECGTYDVPAGTLSVTVTASRAVSKFAARIRLETYSGSNFRPETYPKSFSS